jgi:hypothetical protein
MSPKLNKKRAKDVANAEGMDFTPLDDGIYVARLKEVTVKEGKTSGEPYWNWVFEVIDEDDDDKVLGRQFVNTSLQDNALWKLRETYDAFGVEYDTDTDELVGDKGRLEVITTTIQQGKRAGKPGNEVQTVLPYEEGEGGDGDGDAEPF